MNHLSLQKSQRLTVAELKPVLVACSTIVLHYALVCRTASSAFRMMIVWCLGLFRLFSLALVNFLASIMILIIVIIIIDFYPAIRRNFRGGFASL